MIGPEEIINVRDGLITNIMWVPMLAAGAGLFHWCRRVWPHVKEMTDDHKMRRIAVALVFNLVAAMPLTIWATMHGGAGPSKAAGFILCLGIVVMAYGAWCTFEIIREGAQWWSWRTKPSPPLDI